MSVPDPSRLLRYLVVILRWLLIAIVVFVLTFRAGKYITENWLAKVYTATAQIQILPRGPGGIGPIVPLKNDGGFDPIVFLAEFEIMESPELLLPVIYDLGLDKAWAKRVDKSGLDALPPQDALLPQDALAYMHKILKLDFARGTNIINITVSSEVPKECADIANAIADRYKTMRDVEEEQRTNRGIDSLRDQIAQQQKVVDEKKAALGKQRQDQSPTYHDAQRELEQQQALLDALTVRLKQDIADSYLRESPVRIISRAEAPEYPSKPNKNFAYFVTIVVAGFLSLAVASFVEMVFLFSRASERTDN